jgi:hypothetical protein
MVKNTNSKKYLFHFLPLVKNGKGEREIFFLEMVKIGKKIFKFFSKTFKNPLDNQIVKCYNEWGSFRKFWHFLETNFFPKNTIGIFWFW